MFDLLLLRRALPARAVGPGGLLRPVGRRRDGVPQTSPEHPRRRPWGVPNTHILSPINIGSLTTSARPLSGLGRECDAAVTAAP
jgi:hypothetical protein